MEELFKELEVYGVLFDRTELETLFKKKLTDLVGCAKSIYQEGKYRRYNFPLEEAKENIDGMLIAHFHLEQTGKRHYASARAA